MVWSRQDLVSRLPACPSVFVLAFPCREVGAAMFVQVSSSEQRTMTCKGGPVVKVFFGVVARYFACFLVPEENVCQ